MKWIYGVQRMIVVLITTFYNVMSMKRQGVIYGRRFRTCGRVLYCNAGRRGGITIGDNVNINSLGTRNPGRVEGVTMLITKGSGFIKIGDNVGMSNCVLYSESGISVGDDCTIGAGTKLIDTDGVAYKFWGEERCESKSIRIGNRVFIGGNVIVLKGVSIGDEAVVGSGAVVTKDIGPREIWAGNPAKYIKRLE